MKGRVEPPHIRVWVIKGWRRGDHVQLESRKRFVEGVAFELSVAGQVEFGESWRSRKWGDAEGLARAQSLRGQGAECTEKWGVDSAPTSVLFTPKSRLCLSLSDHTAGGALDKWRAFRGRVERMTEKSREEGEVQQLPLLHISPRPSTCLEVTQYRKGLLKPTRCTNPF